MADFAFIRALAEKLDAVMQPVRLIYRLLIEGDGTSGAMGVKAIATDLNERRFFTRGGGRGGWRKANRGSRPAARPSL